MDQALTPRVLAQARIIARGKRIRDVQHLVAEYGGIASQWAKKGSPRFGISGEQYELHWNEHPGIGRVEVKRKRVSRR